jgi:uncharacterized protein with NRDE domain
MCLIVLAWRARPSHPLVVAANRDEFHARAATPAAFWGDQPVILAGRDLEAGGTWMGVSRSGRFAAVTNYRGGTEPRAEESRGALPTRFLSGRSSPKDFVAEVEKRKSSYSGFNLLVSDGQELWWLSNRGKAARRLDAGYYGLGNLLLDDPEVEPAKARFRTSLEAGVAVEPLFQVLLPARIVNPRYGTRCSTVLIASADGRMQYAERVLSPEGSEGETAVYEYSTRR